MKLYTVKIPIISSFLLPLGAPPKISVSAFLAALILVSLSPAHAQVDGTWKLFTGGGNWSLDTNWTGNPSPVPGGAGSTVGLNTGTGGAVFVTIDTTARTVGTLNFGGTSIWNVNASGGGTLTFDNSASDAVINIEDVAGTPSNHVINAPVILTSSLIVNSNDPSRGLGTGAAGVISGAGSITKNGPGTLAFFFSAINTFSGGFTLNGGTVIGANSGSFGTGTLTLNGGTVGNSGGSRNYSNTLVLGGDMTFGDANGGINTFSGTTTLTASRILTANSAVTLSGNISGTGFGITKRGAGTMTLGGANTFSGNFILDEGAIAMGGAFGPNTNFGSGTLIVNGGSIGTTSSRAVANNVTWSGDANINNGSQTLTYSGTGTLTGNRILRNDATVSYSGQIVESGGSRSLTKTGAGTLSFGSASNTFTGGFSITDGLVNLGGANNLGGGAVTVDGGTLNVATHSSTVGAVTINGGTISNTGSLGLLSSSAGFTVTGGAINAILAGSGGLVKSGAGTATFGVAVGGQNTYTGGTVVNAGTLALGTSDRIVNTGAVTVNGGSFALGIFSDQVGAVTLAGGNITSTTGVLTASSYAVQSGSASAILAGTGAALSKTTSGTATLSGVNTYTGATSISAGTLIVSGSGSISNTSGINASAGTLRYDSSVGLDRNVTLTGGALAYNSSTNYSGNLTFTTGTVGGTNLNGNLNNLSIGAGRILSPGNSPGTASTGNQTWAANGSYLWEINNATATAGADPGWDLISGTGALTISATSANPFTINVTSLTLGNIGGDATNFDGLTTSYAWRIADFGSAIAFDRTLFAINTSGFTNDTTGGIFAVALGTDPAIIGGDNTQIWLTYTAIPEPSAGLLLVGLGVFAVLYKVRRKKLTS